jgi:hypothetical protein
MLKPSALSRKAWKKRPLLKLLRWSGLMRRVVFHATSADELQEIEREFPGAKAVLIPNVPLRPLDELPARPPADGVLRLCLVGRVHPIKNVHLAIEALAGFSGVCELTLVGPEEDPAYAERCRKLAAGLPAGVTVRFAGALQEAQIRELLIRADAMILPTQGENFGHAIFESLGVGTPVIISDRTIWRGRWGWRRGLCGRIGFWRSINGCFGDHWKPCETDRSGNTHGSIQIPRHRLFPRAFSPCSGALVFVQCGRFSVPLVPVLSAQGVAAAPVRCVRRTWCRDQAVRTNQVSVEVAGW